LARHQHESRRAEPALERAGLDEGLLDRIGFGVSFHRGHFAAFGERGEVKAA